MPSIRGSRQAGGAATLTRAVAGTNREKRHRLAFLATLLAGVTLALAAAGLSLAATDCGCSQTGAYEAPAIEAVKPPDGNGLSPGGDYRVTATGSGPINVTVSDADTGRQLLSVSVPASSAWGFSPNGKRFVYNYRQGSVHHVALHNLEASNSQQPVWTTAVATNTAGISFSPHGRYLVYAAVTDTSLTRMTVVDTATGAVAHETAFRFSSPPGAPGQRFGTVSFGFSPDADDRSFVYAYVSGQSSVQWNVVNLAARRLVASETILSLSARWQFSPCGDTIGVIQQDSPTFVGARVLRTRDGSQLGSVSGIRLAQPLTLSVTSTQHQLTSGTSVVRLAANTAAAQCPARPTLSSIAVSPASVRGGTQAGGSVTLSGPSPPGGTVVNLTSSDSAAEVPPSVTVPAGNTSWRFLATTRPVRVATPVTITATSGGVTRTTTLTVTAAPAPAPRPSVSAIALNPPTVTGGDTSTGRVTLTGAAPTGGVSVSLSSANSSVAAVPSTTTVPGGATTASFTATTRPVSETTPVGISASGGGETRTATLTVSSAPTGGPGAVDPSLGCRASALPRNDDGSTGEVQLPFSLNFFGNEYSSLWVNNNGNVTFEGPLSTFTPQPLNTNGTPIIAPFWADVDTRGLGSDVVTYGQSTFGGRAAFCVNWTGVTFGGVGYYSSHTDKLNSFQLLLVDRSDTGMGNFDVVMNYDKIQWETGDASGGFGGLGGHSARMGYTNGDPSSSFEQPGSAINGAFLDSSPTGLVRDSRGTPQLGRYIFPVRNGAPPVGGSISGKVTTPAGEPVAGAPVQVCPRAGGPCAWNGRTSRHGIYRATGLQDGHYDVTALPPAGSDLVRATIGPLEITGNAALTDRDIQLGGPQPPPPDTTISPARTGANGIPIVYWNDRLSLRTTGCEGGNASYRILRGDNSIQNGVLAEGPAGTYTATIPPLSPNVGPAVVRIAIDCPGDTPDETTEFNIYIDPSGLVRTTDGQPVEGATVTLYRSDSSAGPFEAVPNGSDVMSPTNRRNPDETDAAGRFGWDVITGYYKVRAEKEGCHAPGDATQGFVETAVLEIPPPVTDLDLRLACPRPDAVTPASAATVSPEPNDFGWNRDDATVELRAADEDSGVASVTWRAEGAQESPSRTVAGDSVEIPITTEGETTITFFARDRAGNEEPLNRVTIKLDKTAPALDCESPDERWHRLDVSLGCTAHDGGSDLTDPETARFSLSTSVDEGEETADARTGSRTVCDVAGNCRRVGPLGPNKIDRRAPDITIASPEERSYILRERVGSGYRCADGGSGIAACAGPVPSGEAFDTDSIGLKAFRVEARDEAGNTAALSRDYRVVYAFKGFFEPVDNLPTLNTVQAGRAIPLKFSLAGNHGLGVFAADYPKSEQIACHSTAPVDGVERTDTPGASTLTYDPGADRYHYVWKTARSWGGTCRQFVVKLNDGSSHRANFRFR